MLERRQPRNCRLGTLIQIWACGRKAVVSATGLRIVHRDTKIVASHEPLDAQHLSNPPLTIAGEFIGANTRLGHRGYFDWLLVEHFRGTLRISPADWRDRKVTPG